MTRVSVRDDIALVEGYHSPQVDVDVRLNTNESPYPPPAAWRDAFFEELGSVPFHRYPDRQARALRAAIADFHGVAPEQVLAAKGSNEILQALCLAYGGHGRAVATFEPTYALHSHIARLTGTRVASGARAADFSLDLDEVGRLLEAERPSVTFLCSPNNPTGLVEPREVVEEVCARAPGLVVVDEAYAEFAPWTALSLLAGDLPLAVVRTYSKTWSMAAFRLGYLIASPEVVADVERVLLPYHLDAAAQVAGRLALRFTSEMASRVKALVDEREALAAALIRLPVQVWPSGANFVLFRPLRHDATEVWKGLIERSVLIRNCAGWAGLEGCLRVTVGTPDENRAFLAAITEVLTA